MEKYSKIRVSTLLSPETLAKVKNEAYEKCISESAVIRQKVEAMYKFKEEMETHMSTSMINANYHLNNPKNK